MPQPGSYEVRSVDNPERVVIIHLEVVEREVLLAYEHRNAELQQQVTRLMRENARLRNGQVA